jgi:hypothetical protein
VLATAFDEVERRRLLEHGAVVLVITGLSALVGYAFGQFVAGVTGRKIDSRAIAEEVSYYVGCIALIVALLHLTVT